MPLTVGDCLSLHWSIGRDKGADPFVVEVLKGLSHPVLITLPSLCGSGPYSQLFLEFHQGEGSPWGCSIVDLQGSGQASSPLSRLLHPSFHCVEGNGLVKASDRPVASQLLRSAYAVQNGDQPVGPPCSAEGRLDVIHQSQGCVSAGSDPSRQPSLPPVCCGW